MSSTATRAPTSWRFRCGKNEWLVALFSGGGQNGCNLLFLTNKHVFENFVGVNCLVAHTLLRAWLQPFYSTVFSLQTSLLWFQAIW